jgi:hypothetical protein
MRRRLFLPAVVLVLSATACSTSRYRGAIVTPSDVANIRAENPDETLRVEIERPDVVSNARTGAAHSELARLVEVTDDHTTLSLSSEASERVVPNDSITRIVVIRRPEGAVEGVGLGALAGVAAAIVAAATYSDASAEHDGGMYRGETAVVTGLVVGVPAMLVGGLLGAAIGNWTNYTFGPAAAARAE